MVHENIYPLFSILTIMLFVTKVIGLLSFKKKEKNSDHNSTFSEFLELITPQISLSKSDKS